MGKLPSTYTETGVLQVAKSLRLHAPLTLTLLYHSVEVNRLGRLRGESLGFFTR